MDSKIYYIPEHKTVSITSNYSEIKKWMDLGINPKVEYIPVAISELNKFEINRVGFDKVDNNYFQTVKELFSKLKLRSVAFHEATLDLSDVIIAAQELFIGEKSKVNLSEKNFKDPQEVTFLSVKTFKGKVLDTFETVKKLTVWDNTKTSTLPEMFPNITELIVNKGSLTELDLTRNKNLEKLEIHYCSKLERIVLPENHKLKEVVIENCKNLDLSNLPTEVTSVWPPRKENVITSSAEGEIQSTGNKQIDSLLHDLKKNMMDFMNEAEPSYHQSDIRECLSILTDYTIKIFAAKSKVEGMEIVKSAILKLNDLNEKCDYSLIETNEREQIAEIIILAGNEMGYNSADEDITEEWREW